MSRKPETKGERDALTLLRAVRAYLKAERTYNWWAREPQMPMNVIDERAETWDAVREATEPWWETET